MAPIDPWRNSTPVFRAVAFCTTNIKDFKTPLTSTSSTILSTYSSQRRSVRWTSSKRKIREVIEVDQIEDTYNERLNWAMLHSGLKIENKKIKIKNIKFCPPKNLVLPPLPHMYSGRMCRFAPFFFHFFSPSRPFLIDGVLGSKNLFSKTWRGRPKS